MKKTKTDVSYSDLKGGPRVQATQIRLLERLCNAVAVSGAEGEIRNIVLEEIKPYCDDDPQHLKVDAMGNILATRLGISAERENRLRVMLAAHMDEVGLMVVQDDSDGMFRFEVVGGIDKRQLVGKPVWVGKDHVPGVIGAKPIHLVKADEVKRAVSLEEMRIDVGSENKDKVKVGDWASFATPFQRIGPSLRAKALDDRLGVASLITLIQCAPPNIDLLAAFTVQEEVGLRGAGVAAYAFNPDVAIILDCTPAYDLPDWHGEENISYNTRLGAGPAIYVADAATISDPRLMKHFITTAEELGIPYQIRQPGRGATDAGAIHRRRGGIPSLSISVPGRYLHTPVSLVRLADWQNTLSLVYAGLCRLTADILTQTR